MLRKDGTKRGCAQLREISVTTVWQTGVSLVLEVFSPVQEVARAKKNAAFFGNRSIITAGPACIEVPGPERRLDQQTVS